MAHTCVHLLVLALFLAVHVCCCKGNTVCPPCGKLAVPYPLSTLRSCGHPLYKVTCTPEKKLEVHALSGNYTVKSLDPLSRTMVIATASFLGDSCITEDSVSAHNFSLFPGAPLTVAPGNTVMILNISSLMINSPLNCSKENPCFKALSVLPLAKCRAFPCCSFITNGNNFPSNYGFPVHGLATGYVSALNAINPMVDASRWTFGLRLQWEVPREPPCAVHTHCGGHSTCVASPNVPFLSTDGGHLDFPPHGFCLCNKGFVWEPIGTCVKMPYCERKSGSIECHKAQYAAGLSTGVPGLIALSALIICALKKRRAAQRAHAKLVKERAMILATNNGGKSARLFSSKEMRRATNGFARNRLLGCGGFGEVYKGILDDTTVVAIKSAKMGNVKGIDQVLNEVRILAQVNHRSLVRLLGCCVESELPLLVYEYVPNGNLHEHIHSKGKALLWHTRLRIALQSAEGLSYLHSAAYPAIYHRDVKSSNILLDESMNAKVADFGLSLLVQPDLTHVSTMAQGTLGYLDPEYYRSYQLSDKSDVYSFGVVLLELVTSQRVIDFGRSEDDVNLVVMVQVCREQGNLDGVLDPDIVDGPWNETVNSMMSVIDLALECLHENRLSRPSMKEVAETLQQIIYSLVAATQLAAP